jgi:hypothetical protein
LNLVWDVSAFNEGGRWVWQRTGQIQPFEETAAYNNRRIKDRFTKEMLIRYCDALSIPLDVHNYGSESLLELPYNVENTSRRESLHDARIRFDLI